LFGSSRLWRSNLAQSLLDCGRNRRSVQCAGVGVLYDATDPEGYIRHLQTGNMADRAGNRAVGEQRRDWASFEAPEGGFRPGTPPPGSGVPLGCTIRPPTFWLVRNLSYVKIVVLTPPHPPRQFAAANSASLNLKTNLLCGKQGSQLTLRPQLPVILAPTPLWCTIRLPRLAAKCWIPLRALLWTSVPVPLDTTLPLKPVPPIMPWSAFAFPFATCICHPGFGYPFQGGGGSGVKKNNNQK